MNFTPFLAPLADALKSRMWQALLCVSGMFVAAYNAEFIPAPYALKGVCAPLVLGATLQVFKDVCFAFAGREHRGPAQVRASGASPASTVSPPATPVEPKKLP